MKTILYTIAVAVILGSCNSMSQQTNKAKAPKEDSIRKVTLNIGSLSAKEYLYYHDLLQQHFESQLLHRGFNGGILVAKNGVIVYEDYQGFRDLRIKDSLTDRTPLHIASASKTFTGMAIMQLVQQGKLNLNDELNKFFPGFPYPGVTIKNLLSHRSGLPNYVHYLENLHWDKTRMVTNQDVLNSLFTLKPNKEAFPDKRFSYSNTNYALLALIIEKITGEAYPAYMKKTFFDPLGMNDTFVATAADSSRLTPSFDARGRVWKPDFLDLTYGDKNIYSTPRDLLKWDIAMSNGQIINQQMMDLAYTPYSNERPSIHNYGLGWRLLMLKNGKKIIYHNGRWHGSNAAFARLLSEKATIIIIGNRYNSNIYSSAKKAYDLFGDYVQDGADDDEEKLTTNEEKSESSTSGQSLAAISSIVSPIQKK
ncbi:MAG: beta-lactamase family protein [Bacteroidetes bacterium]|nr:beta-lactamase family protein [Bacteroidota bacterium]